MVVEMSLKVMVVEMTMISLRRGGNFEFSGNEKFWEVEFSGNDKFQEVENDGDYKWSGSA